MACQASELLNHKFFEMNITLFFTDPVTQKSWEEVINKAEQLELYLTSLQEKYKDLHCPIGIGLEWDEENFLSVGLGNNGWVLIQTIGEDEQLCSLGDSSLEGTVAFYLPQWTEVPKKMLIPKEKAWEVVKYWFETGKLSSLINWTEQNY